jgi:hypothetical protein
MEWEQNCGDDCDMFIEQQHCIFHPQYVNTFPTPLVQGIVKLMCGLFCIDLALVSISIFGFRVLPIHYLHLEFHATWAPTQSVCEVLNPESSTKTVIAALVSDVILLLTMLVGLLRLRHGGTMIGLGKFLWRQVRCCTSLPLPLCLLITYCERV